MTRIKLGGDERTLQPFSGAKAMEAGALVAEIVDQGNGIIAAMNTYSQEQAARNTIRVPRAAAFYRDPDRAAQVPADAWEASGNTLEVPGSPPAFEEQIVAVFPLIYRTARSQVLKLLALVLVDEHELEEADVNGGADGVAELLEKEGRALLYKSRMEELIAIGAGAWEMCQEQLQADPTALALFTRLQGLRGASTAKSSEPSSSTGSPARTAGRGKKSSSASRGASSQRSTASS